MIQLVYRWMQNLAVYMLLVTAFLQALPRIATGNMSVFLRTSSDSSACPAGSGPYGGSRTGNGAVSDGGV
ncbi:MAG: hypothetical protein ACLR2O_02860 [Coprococcus sp.]